MEKFTIIYDDIIFRLQKKGGISYVFSELINDKSLNERVTKNLFLTSRRNNQNIYFKSFNLKFIYHKIKIPQILTQFFPLIITIKDRCIFHLTYYNFLFAPKNVIKVITIHDFGYENKLMRLGIRRIVNVMFKRIAIKNANGIICVSYNTKNDLIKYYGNCLHNKSVEVIYNGINDYYFEKKTPSPIVNTKYILFVGSRADYKQFDLAIKLIELIKDRILVIVGGSELNKQELENLKSISGRYISDINVEVERIKQYYDHAECLLYPSKYEGFGLPVIEANACGCPVLAGKHSSILEISNNLNFLVDNNDVTSYYKEYLNLRNTMTDDMKNCLIENAKNFKSKKFRENTYNYYFKLLNECK